MTNQKVGILEYGAGNFGSVRRALEALSITPLAVASAQDLNSVDRLVFPGVGSAHQAMSQLRRRGLDDALRSFASSGRPLLGICVGMQVLGEWSAEGDTRCLGLLPYKIKKFSCDAPIPHMGWNSLNWNRSVIQSSNPDVTLQPAANFYFVHSFAAFLKDDEEHPAFVAATSSYGGQTFAAVVVRENVWGAQCHVEKSGRAGLQFLRSFLSAGDR